MKTLAVCRRGKVKKTIPKGVPTYFLLPKYFVPGQRVTIFTEDECSYTRNQSYAKETCKYSKTCKYKGFGVKESSYWICSKLVQPLSRMEKILEAL